MLEDAFYPGKHNSITINSQYSARIACSFDLYVYPFDVQVCNIGLRLPHDTEDNVFFNMSARATIFTGKQDLSLYTISNVHFDPESMRYHLGVVFELCRRQGLVLMTTFIPSMLLLLVSWATLFIKLEALNVRTGMALTTLLVLYTLFANFSRSVPQTDVVKLVDIWFFFIIMLLFLNIMIHIFVDYVALLHPRIKGVAPKGHSVGDIAYIAEKFLKIYRLFVFPGIFLIFNVIFWIVMFQY